MTGPAGSRAMIFDRVRAATQTVAKERQELAQAYAAFPRDSDHATWVPRTLALRVCGRDHSPARKRDQTRVSCELFP
jgi:hypothetical protein